MTTALGAVVRRVRGALHPALVLAAIVLGAFLLALPVLLKVPDWVVMTDELLYTKLAISVGHDLSLAPPIHGEPYALLSQVDQLLLAPIMAWFDMPTAFKAAHVVNGLLMASTAIPAYLLARSADLSRAAAYGVATLSVVTPWVVLAEIIWTEPVAYPAFVWALLAMHRATVAPSARNDILVLVGLAVAFFARTQFALLPIVFPVVLVLHRVGYALTGRPRTSVLTSLRSLLREHRVLLGLAGLAAIVVLIGGGRGRLLGAYSVTASGDLLPAGVVHFAVQHLAAVAVGLGVVPLILALGWSAATLFRPLGRERHALAALALVVTPALLLQASSFTLRFASPAHHDRYVFYLAPLLFAGTVACVIEGRRCWPFVLAAGLVVAGVLGTLSYIPGTAPPFFDSPAGVFWPVWYGKASAFGQMLGIADLSPQTAFRWGSVLAGAGLAAALWWLPRRVAAPAVVLLLLVFLVGETQWVLRHASFDTAAQAPNLSGRDWVDDALHNRAEVGLVPVFVGNSEADAQRVWWSAEFWNKDVTAAFRSNGASTYTPFPADTMTVNPERGTIESSKNLEYLVVARTDLRFRIAGPTLAESEVLALIRPLAPYRAAWATRDLGPDGWTLAGHAPSLRLFDLPDTDPGRRVSIRMQATGDVVSARAYVLSDGGRRSSGVVNVGEEVTASLMTCVPRSGTTDLRLDVRGSNLLPDGRRIGLRVMEIDVAPAASRGCDPA
jgi:hypothetical protein